MLENKALAQNIQNIFQKWFKKYKHDSCTSILQTVLQKQKVCLF